VDGGEGAHHPAKPHHRHLLSWRPPYFQKYKPTSSPQVVNLKEGDLLLLPLDMLKGIAPQVRTLQLQAHILIHTKTCT